jgi:site-specific recombinase XerD
MLSGCKLLKHKILIGILYGCGLRCMEVRNLRLCDLDFDRKQLKVVQGKGKKDRYLPLSEHLIRGLKKYIEAEKPENYLFGMPREGRAALRFRSAQASIPDIATGRSMGGKAGIKNGKYIERSDVHTLRNSFATHLLEDGMDIWHQKSLGLDSIDTTLIYLQIAQIPYKYTLFTARYPFFRFGKK